MPTKITVLFYSTYGTNHGVALEAVRAAEAAGAEVRLRRCRETAPADVVNGQDAWREQVEKMQDIPEATLDDMEWADGYFISVPTRFGVPASQFRAFVDTLGPLWQSGALANKAVTATTSAQNTHGGQETTIQSVYVTAMHWGAVIVAPGYANPIKFEDGGNPYGYSCKPGPLDETGRKSVTFQAQRLVEYAEKLTR
ncbi:NAD(P)H-dependent oxidoreductase [Limimaricola cinnabarinus]|uniref:Trp repressor binding protein WrbA, putative n=1 Tax=Limimaricola cinnabarinus LL-001 TaxID=1337093 RepID=U3AB82_9RHOB|nr:NAD(P)H-dependent oxidoreductase [Limimaricola cinnabarinus]GAD54919.1 trp repressor binding protein WrbA, putative [Limimaricola cinnabarinus LL-001]